MKINFDTRYLKFILPLCMVLAAAIMHAQTTTITGIVTDSDSQVWAGATWVANLNVLGGNPVFICGGSSGQPVPRSYSGTLTSGGAFQTATVADNNCIVPAGTTWTFTMQSLTSAAPSVVGPYVITGVTQAMGAVISSAITVPRFEAAHLTYAYLPVEINDPVAGTGYVNTASNTSWLYNGISYIQTGGGGGCTGGSVTGNVSFSGQVGDFQSGCLASVGNPFSMGLSCSQAGLREIGNATTNPFNCTLSYSNGTPASATLGDGTNTDTLTTPFTSGSLAFAYSSNTTFTAHSTATNSQTASTSTSVTFAAREFGGVGTSGATGATSSGSTAVLTGATGTLNTVGLGQQSNWGPYTPSNQNIYVLGTGSSCSFTSGGFNFPMNTPTPITFVNLYGASISMYLYQSTNLLSTSFTLNGTC